VPIPVAVLLVLAGLVGGPMLTVPLLVACGTRILESLAAAQAQSVVIAGVGTIGYLACGAIDWPLAALIGVPELAGVLIGWRIARILSSRVLAHVLVIALFAMAPYLALQRERGPADLDGRRVALSRQLLRSGDSAGFCGLSFASACGVAYTRCLGGNTQGVRPARGWRRRRDKSATEGH
jgi:uncharacterized membrane protein YfcA